jgi:hypothetical protein
LPKYSDGNSLGTSIDMGSLLKASSTTLNLNVDILISVAYIRVIHNYAEFLIN